MVFKEISKGISNLGTSTKKAVDTATSPLTDVSKKVVKTLPLIGDDNDIWLQVADHVRIETYLEHATQGLGGFTSSLKNNKIPKGIAKDITASLQSAYSTATSETDFKTMYTSVRSKHDEVVKTITKLSLKKTKKEQILLAFHQHTRELDLLRHQLDDLIGYITVSPSESNHISDNVTTWRKQGHIINDALITTKFDLITQMQKLYYLIMELDKLYTKARTKKNALILSQIQEITKNNIPKRTKKIKEIITNIQELQAQSDVNTSKLFADLKHWGDVLSDRKGLNKDTSKTSIAQQKKLLSTSKKTITKLQKSYASSIATESKEFPKLIDKPRQIQAVLQKEIDSYNTLSPSYIDHLSHEYLIYLTQAKDLRLEESLSTEHETMSVQHKVISKELSLQHSLIHRIHRRQQSTLTKLQKKLSELQKIHKTKFTTVSSVLSSTNNHISTQTKNYQKTITKQKEKSKLYQSHIKKHKATAKALHKKLEALEKSSKAMISKHFVGLLAPELKHTQSHIASLEGLIQDLETSNIKLGIQIQETQKSAQLLHDIRRKKEALAYEKQLHAQEVTLDTLIHHLEWEKEHEEVLKYSIK